MYRLPANAFGSQALVVAVDARRRPNSPGNWEVFTHGGRKGTGIDAVTWCARVAGLGAGEILLTSMDRDGTRDGFDLELTRAVADRVPIPVIASGGVGTLEHLYQGVVQGGADAVLKTGRWAGFGGSLRYNRDIFATAELPHEQRRPR